MENQVGECSANGTEEATDHVNLGSDSEDVHIAEDTEKTAGDTNMARRPVVLYGEPEVGMTFDTDDDAYHFYSSYARSVGFKVRKLRQNQNKHGEIRKREFCCSCEGFYCKKRSPQKKREERRFGCKAMLEIRLNQSKKYVVTKFEAEHTHSLAPASSSHVLYNRDSSPMAQFGELCQIAHRITSEGAKTRHSYTFVKAKLLKLEEKLKSFQHTGQDHTKRNGDLGSGNHSNEDGVHIKLQDPETEKSKGRGKGKMKNALGSKDSKNQVSSERKDSREPNTHLDKMSDPSVVPENVQGSIGVGKEKELSRSSLCLGGQFPGGFPTASGGQAMPYHLPGHRFILPMISNRSFMYSQEIQSSLPRPQGPARLPSSSNPSTS
ncbi:uncharacterized protein LOC126798494 [Argentina anserina]|uniref:uncharacterized protein LOC126798494 n=1 Tax=Argentina anserina TaxID=57926 RepID=UPI0021764103|nr:uncharacterized protein LOC126798494 [Potentilla anserina]